jgi:SAM-dependent methyltransferase
VTRAPERCILCGGAPRSRFARDDFAIVACGDCGLEWRDPFPSADELAATYAGDYFERWGADTPEALARVRAMKEASYARFLAELVRCGGKGSLLDVGCAHGFLLGAARRFGFDVYGVEPNPGAARAAREEFGDRVHAGVLGADAFGGRRFDALTLMDVLEHVPEPKAFLAAARERLVPGGLLMAVLPNSRSLVARVLGRRWPHYAGEHLFHWSPRTLESLLRRAGFEVRALRTGVRKTFTTAYLRDYARQVGSWLPPGLARAPDMRIRAPTGEMLVVAVASP